MQYTALLALSLIALPSWAAGSGQPTTHVTGPLSVKEPETGSWEVLRKNSFGVVFKRGEAPGITNTIAYTSSYAADGPLDAAGLMAEVKRNASQFLAAPSAKLLSTEFVQHNDRSYPCVHITATAQITTPNWPEADLFRQMRALVCQPLGNTKFGFLMGFSYSAGKVKEDYEAQARQFFNGVQLADK